ncbi:glycoside hydrolase family 28 domain-containing protein [Alishewanella agri BL06]|uniref:Glycoside hydrolase family 28 domain-containing protein n=1 Tax=Alishewanella agri BL06 TaxID=1195246 RepID=I9NZ06_9ALTE|nr:glycoside hydrolase family 28 protein [Alishewanella agri]EIW87837.1 glycoside hydrolase family 28 domain-containing protein [Alishewanella agri BL06]
MTDLKKRNSLKLFTAASASLSLLSVSGCQSVTALPVSAKDADDLRQWQQADQIIAAIKPVKFPDRSFSITDFGAAAKAGFDNTAAIAAAIAACAAAGGGRVLIPGGRFETGAIHLKSNVNLHLADDTVLSFYTDREHYLPYVMTRWEGVELMGYSPLIYAYQQENIALTGNGILEGNGAVDAWWPWKGQWERRNWDYDASVDQVKTRSPLFEMAERGVPVSERVFNENFLRPPFIQPYGCKRVLIEGVTIRNSPFWLINPVLSEDVIVRNVNCISYGPNSDGCNPESCNRVLIENCLFDTGDDCIALKSGRNNDGRRLATPVQNVVIQDCIMRAGHGGVVMGSEISGGARNIFARRCRMSSPNLARGIRIKTNSVRGGLIENVYIRDIEIGEVRDAIVINFFYEEGDAGNFMPQVNNLHISNLTVQKAQRAFELRGFERAPISGVTLHHVQFNNTAALGVLENIAGIDQLDVSLNGRAISI